MPTVEPVAAEYVDDGRARLLAELADIGRVLDATRHERSAAVVAAVRAGLSQREVARAVGLSHTAVQIIVRSTAD